MQALTTLQVPITQMVLETQVSIVNSLSLEFQVQSSLVLVLQQILEPLLTILIQEQLHYHISNVRDILTHTTSTDFLRHKSILLENKMVSII